jgi:hypothetical protein
MNKERLLTLSLLVFAAAIARIVPHPANVAPIAAIALFSGAQFDRKWQAFSIPLAAMLLSDLVIGFYSQMWVTYLAFAAVVCIGFKLRGNPGFTKLLLGTLAGSIAFFLITNFALWSHYEMYPHTLDGIMQSYTMALPFFRNSLFGDLFYSGLLFGGFILAQRSFPALKAA